MSTKSKYSTPKYDEYVLAFPQLIEEFRDRYKTATGWEKYMLGRKAAEYSSNLVDLEAGLHLIVYSSREGAICNCGLRVPSSSYGEEFPEFLNTPGHLDINKKPVKTFYFFKYLAPQYRILHIVCQVCKVIEEVTPRETGAPRSQATHKCEEGFDFACCQA